MLAVRLHGNSDLRVDQVPEPDAVGPGQVRVEPQWCGICGTDLHEYAHGPLYTPAENLPQVIGHEFSAVIAETGPGVTAFRPGDRVAVLPHVFCGSCFYCLRGRQGLCSNLKLTGVTWPWGGLAGQAIVPASQVVPLPDGVSFEQGAVLEPVVQDLGHPADPGPDRGRDAPVERVVTSRIGMRDVVRKGIQRLADPGGGQVKILVSAAGKEAAGKEAAGQEEA